MNEIEERAKETYPKGVGVFTAEGAELLQKAYIHGATEQRENDIDKAIKAHCEICVIRSLCAEKSTLNNCPETKFIRDAINE